MALLGAALAAWIVLFAGMRGMDGLGWFLGFWVTMTAAMMLPSVAPVTLGKPSHQLAVRAAEIEIEHVPGAAGSEPAASSRFAWRGPSRRVTR